jgi:hypothetical protein
MLTKSPIYNWYFLSQGLIIGFPRILDYPTSDHKVLVLQIITTHLSSVLLSDFLEKTTFLGKVKLGKCSDKSTIIKQY